MEDHAAEVASQRGSASEDDALVPIRMVEALRYCPRQAWYRFVAGDDPLNIHMERGLRRHETFGEASPTNSEGSVFRHVAVRAPVLGVTGVLDEVIVGERLIVVEYKTARLSKWIWPGILTQLATQHLALREHVETNGWTGPALPEATVLRVFFADSRRQREVIWSAKLDAMAREAIDECRRVLASALPPEGLVGPRCTECQHEPICLPWDRPLLARVAESGP